MGGTAGAFSPRPRMGMRAFWFLEGSEMLIEDFVRQAVGLGDLVHARLPCDLETPTSVFLRVEDRAGAFLLESVEGGESLGRYSFVGWDPLVTVSAGRDGWQLATADDSAFLPEVGGDVLRLLLHECSCSVPAGLPPLAGGLVGYIGYDTVRAYERLGQAPTDDLGLPDSYLLYPGILCALDHVGNTLHILARGDGRASAEERLEAALAALRGSIPSAQPTIPSPEAGRYPVISNLSKDRYCDMVRAAKEYIRAGDIFQVVLSQRLSKPLNARPFQIYRVLRRLNPSPYMFHLRCTDGIALVGSSPEMFVRLRGDLAEQRPLAGTRRRGANQVEDAELEADLRADDKERAEHVMLVDLARNDLGRVCRYGTVSVPTLLDVERFSHVMHLVSHVTGRLAAGKDAIDLLIACLPAGTVSGAPKVRAMQIIDELEPTRRGPYAGAVGYLDIRGNMDTCITIRTVITVGDRAYVQAGAGIVADSDPEREYQETMNKAAALLSALDAAEEV